MGLFSRDGEIRQHPSFMRWFVAFRIDLPDDVAGSVPRSLRSADSDVS